MRTGLDPYIRVGIDAGGPLRVPLADGATVDVEVLARASDGAIRVRVGGKILVAASSGLFEPGDAFQARVRLARDAVFLDPAKGPAAARSSVLARLSLPDTGDAAFLVRFFARSLLKLDSVQCRALLSVSSRFPGRERRAVEAAAILESHGLRSDDETVSMLMDAIEGRPFPGETDGDGSRGGKREGKDAEPDAGDGAKRRLRDFVAFVNHKKGHERHWIVIPFTREIAGATVQGSVRCMIDLATSRCLETLVTVNDGERVWDFDLFGVRCDFRANPPFAPVKNGEIAVYLRGILEMVGYTDVCYQDFSSAASREIPAVDLEA